MASKKGALEDRWEAHPVLAGVVRGVTFLVPLAASTLFAIIASASLPPASSRTAQVLIWVLVTSSPGYTVAGAVIWQYREHSAGGPGRHEAWQMVSRTRPSMEFVSHSMSRLFQHARLPAPTVARGACSRCRLY